MDVVGTERRDAAYRDHEPRLFVAVPLAEDTRGAIGDLVGDVRSRVEDGRGKGANDRPVRWVSLESLHLTLRFLGATPPDRLDLVAGAVRNIAARGQPFSVELGGAGAFPSSDRPRVLWLGIRDGVASLSALATDLASELEQRGWPSEDRPYRAHLTLARADGVRAGPRTASALVAAAADKRWAFQAEQIVLFESRMSRGPARYEPLVTASLGISRELSHA